MQTEKQNEKLQKASYIVHIFYRFYFASFSSNERLIIDLLINSTLCEVVLVAIASWFACCRDIVEWLLVVAVHRHRDISMTMTLWISCFI